MSRTRKRAPRRGGRDYNVTVRSVRRTPPDLPKLSRAAMQIALEQAAAEKAAQEAADRKAQPEQPDA